MNDLTSFKRFGIEKGMHDGLALCAAVACVIGHDHRGHHGSSSLHSVSGQGDARHRYSALVESVFVHCFAPIATHQCPVQMREFVGHLESERPVLEAFIAAHQFDAIDGLVDQVAQTCLIHCRILIGIQPEGLRVAHQQSQRAVIIGAI